MLKGVGMKVKPYIKLTSNATNQTYTVYISENFLYKRLVEAIADNFSTEDLIEHAQEMFEQIFYDLSTDNVNWIITADV